MDEHVPHVPILVPSGQFALNIRVIFEMNFSHVAWLPIIVPNAAHNYVAILRFVAFYQLVLVFIQPSHQLVAIHHHRRGHCARPGVEYGVGEKCLWCGPRFYF